MKFKALLSPTQTFVFEGTGYQAADGFFYADDEKLIEFLKSNHGFDVEVENETIEEINEIEEPVEEVIEEIEQIEEPIEDEELSTDIVEEIVEQSGEIIEEVIEENKGNFLSNLFNKEAQ